MAKTIMLLVAVPLTSGRYEPVAHSGTV